VAETSPAASGPPRPTRSDGAGDPDDRPAVRLPDRTRHVAVQPLLRTASGTDADAAAVWSQLSDERFEGLAMFAQALAPVLRPDVTVEHARDVPWADHSPELWDLLVAQRGGPRRSTPPIWGGR
jgi:hypothetical protein